MTHFLELLVTFGFLGALMWGMMKFMLRDIHNDLQELKIVVKDIRRDMKASDARIDHLYEENNRLYRTIIEIIRSKNG